jgi:hypothetical protein
VSLIDVNGLHRGRVGMIELRRERTASQCVCCGGEDLAASPAILMPFVADRIFGWKPVVVDESWGLRTIASGNAYALCNSLRCRDCGHLFCDIRFSDSEMASLYHKYREEDYTSLRDHYEPGYRARNEALNEPVIYVDRIESFLRPHVEMPITVLDWGGDTGINTPFKRESEVFDVYDISAKDVEAGARLVTRERVVASRYRLIVCAMLLEHVPYPLDILLAARQSMDAGSVLYIEVPFEAQMRESLESPEQHKKHWHEHINFYSQASLEALVTNCGFEVIARNVLSTNVAGADVDILQFACRLGGSVRFEG